jgi:diguanylate cyclase (GGDEF)-like protein/PAS domain S-box-containing protein
VFDIPADSVRLTAQACRLLCPDVVGTGYASPLDGAKVSGAQLFISVMAEDRDPVDSAWRAALAGGVFDVEHRVLQGGELRWLRHIAQVEMDGTGHPFRAIGTLQDITERKQSEQALRESEFLWKFAVEGARDGVWDWDLQTNAMQFSPRWREMMGYAPDDATPDGKARALQIHPDDRARVKAMLDTYLSGESDVYAVEARFLCKDGTYKWVLGRGMVVSRDANEVPVRMIGTTTDISERKHMEEQVQHLAFYDALTNLPNRRLQKDRMQQAMSSSKRLGTYCALMFLDLDNFKPLNDAYGHDAGDVLLVEVAQRIKRCVREVDSVARFGGDEFVVMLVELSAHADESLAQARLVAEKVRAALAQPYTVPLKNTADGVSAVTHHCTVSVGAVLFLGHEQSQDEVLKRADRAMYQAKEQGRNAVCFAL